MQAFGGGEGRAWSTEVAGPRGLTSVVTVTLTHGQLEDRLRWLSWWAPGVFTAVMDYADFTDALAADIAPAAV